MCACALTDADQVGSSTTAVVTVASQLANYCNATQRTFKFRIAHAAYFWTRCNFSVCHSSHSQGQSVDLRAVAAGGIRSHPPWFSDSSHLYMVVESGYDNTHNERSNLIKMYGCVRYLDQPSVGDNTMSRVINFRSFARGNSSTRSNHFILVVNDMRRRSWF